MKLKFVVIVFAVLLPLSAQAQLTRVSIKQIQEVPLDSLLKLDSCGTCGWTLQASAYLGDTVGITAVCVVPPKVLTYTAAGFTMLLYDTGAVAEWGAIFVRVNVPTDSSQAILDGFLNVHRGDVIEMVGIVSEFPMSSPLSTTQLQPVSGIPIIITGTAPIPPPIHKTIGDFNRGYVPSMIRPHYSTGEPFESMVVEIY